MIMPAIDRQEAFSGTKEVATPLALEIPRLDPRPHLPVYLAYNVFLLAAIFQGIVGRARDGMATSENARAMAPLVRPLAGRARQFARAAGAQ
jgi:hypothetical protein